MRRRILASRRIEVSYFEELDRIYDDAALEERRTLVAGVRPRTRRSPLTASARIAKKGHSRSLVSVFLTRTEELEYDFKKHY